MIGETGLKPTTLGKTRTLREIEAAIHKICDNPGRRFLIQADMLSARRGAMHDAARLQLIVTLARQQLQSDYLDFNPQADVQTLLRNLGNCSPGIAAVRLSKGIRLGEQIFNRREVFRESVERMQAMDAGRYEDVVNGRVVDLICVAGSKVQHLRPLFRATGQVKPPSEMAAEMRRLIDFVNKQSGRTSIPESLIESLGLFCTELVSNTQEHATSDHLGLPYFAHVEGVMVGWRRLEDEIFAEDFDGSEDLRRYWQRESSTTDNNKTSLRALHISFFDSGPGFASRMSGKAVQEMSLPEEREQLLRCLQPRKSSKTLDAAGLGLPAILNELRKVGGLIRIRSGRLCVYNQFEENDRQRAPDDFRDWDNADLAPVAGAVITIMIPLRGM
ncbi:TPA: hypothetical protein NJF67_003508 [Pseudomonas aeruginosa]|nr:hypothetical protein [Pseudomonas aeruginosa]HDZ3382574.1 hypothetical protein [Pseudomonas aeruginosa]